MNEFNRWKKKSEYPMAGDSSLRRAKEGTGHMEEEGNHAQQ